MKLISCLSVQMPWLSIQDFHQLVKLKQTAVDVKDWHLHFTSQKTKEFLSEKISEALRSAQKLSEECESASLEILYPGHRLYSDGFSELEDPPLFLTLRGQWAKGLAMAVVGSREPSRLAIDWLNEHLSAALKVTPFTVLSGGARGIDLCAHLNAVRSGYPTVVFSPSGLNRLYPKDLARWEAIILETGGGFVSELPPEYEMRKHYFVKRNRLIVAAADLVFVAEARRKSGSMLTAKIALRMNRNLCTLPASPALLSGQGSLDLIFDGAFPLRDHLDLIALLGTSSKLFEVSPPPQ